MINISKKTKILNVTQALEALKENCIKNPNLHPEDHLLLTISKILSDNKLFIISKKDYHTLLQKKYDDRSKRNFQYIIDKYGIPTGKNRYKTVVDYDDIARYFILPEFLKLQKNLQK